MSWRSCEAIAGADPGADPARDRATYPPGIAAWLELQGVAGWIGSRLRVIRLGRLVGSCSPVEAVGLVVGWLLNGR